MSAPRRRIHALFCAIFVLAEGSLPANERALGVRFDPPGRSVTTAELVPACRRRLVVIRRLTRSRVAQRPPWASQWVCRPPRDRPHGALVMLLDDERLARRCRRIPATRSCTFAARSIRNAPAAPGTKAEPRSIRARSTPKRDSRGSTAVLAAVQSTFAGTRISKPQAGVCIRRSDSDKQPDAIITTNKSSDSTLQNRYSVCEISLMTDGDVQFRI